MSRSRILQQQFDTLVEGIVRSPHLTFDQDECRVFSRMELEKILHQVIDAAMTLNLDYTKHRMRHSLEQARRDYFDESTGHSGRPHS